MQEFYSLAILSLSILDPCPTNMATPSTSLTTDFSTTPHVTSEYKTSIPTPSNHVYCYI